MAHPVEDPAHTKVEADAALHPQQTDLAFAEITYTDERLNRAVNNFLVRLIAAHQGSIPGVYLPPSPDLVVVSAVGCLEAGGASSPLDA
jgi:non-ribosomal peptide synthetase component F